MLLSNNYCAVTLHPLVWRGLFWIWNVRGESAVWTVMMMMQEHGLAVQDITLLIDYTCVIYNCHIYIYIYIYAVTLKHLFCNYLMCIHFLNSFCIEMLYMGFVQMTSDIDIHLLLQKYIVLWLIIKYIFIIIYYFIAPRVLAKDVLHSSYYRKEGRNLKKWLRNARWSCLSLGTVTIEVGSPCVQLSTMWWWRIG